MLNCLKFKKIGIFAGGVLFGTAGVKVLASRDAKKFYINCLAAGLRAKDSVMTTAACIQENADDIMAEAREINRQRSETDGGDEGREEAAEETCCDAAAQDARE